MKYILIKNNSEVFKILDNEPVSVTSNLTVARCNSIPKGKKHLAINIRENQEEYTDKVTETVTLATGVEKEIVKEVTKTKTYLTCDLIAIKE